MSKEGYEPKQENVSIKANDRLEKDINLKKLPAGVSSNPNMGFLTVASPNEKVLLKIQGVPGIHSLPLEYYELVHGNYNLKAFGIGLESEKRDVQIKKQKTTKVEFELRPKSRQKALRYSFMFPGGGQFYEGSNSRIRGLIYAATFIGTGALLNQRLSSYSDEKNLLDDYKANYQSATSAEDIDATWTRYEKQANTVNNVQTNLIILSTTLISTYVSSIIDSYFFSDLK
jgi:hypothetical protein